MERSAKRRAFLATLGAALAGCSGGDGAQTTASPGNPVVGDVEQVGDLGLTSPAFEDGGSIPDRYGRDAENVNPPLSIVGVPGEAASLVLVVDDPDAREPAGEVWLHWLVWNIPPGTTEIPEDWSPSDAVVGKNDFGERGYGGPDPPDGTHTYRFKLFALDRTLDLSSSASKRDVGAAMEGSVLAQTQLEGTYAP